MREIKFRVWDKDCKRMHVCGDNTHDTIYFFEDNCACYYNLQNGEGSSPDGTGTYKLMQYTGLHDKNGKEIYEGDAVRCYGGEHCQGHWEFDRTVVITDITDYEVMALLCESEHIEVIGNVHDDPNLLEVTE